MRLNESTQLLIRRVSCFCRQYLPTTHAFWAGPTWDMAEDLTDDGLRRKYDKLLSLSNEIEEKQKRDNTTLSQVVFAELLRFIHEQILIHEKENPYITDATAYLKLSSFSLLPPYLCSILQNCSSNDLNLMVNVQIEKCLKWFSICEERVQNSHVLFANSDISVAKKIILSLQKEPFSKAGSSKILQKKLSEFAKVRPREISRAGVSINIKEYIHEIIGFRSSIDKLFENLQDRLKVEISKLMETSRKKTTSPRNLQINSDTYLKLLQDVRESTSMETLKNIGSNEKIIKMPSFMEPFGGEALFLPGAIAQLSEPDAILMFRDMPFQSSVSFTGDAYFLLILAHELCPGHGEHYQRSLVSPLYELFQITRSPIGFEGWASFAEGRIATLDDKFHGLGKLIDYRRIRRLFAAFKLTGRITLGENESEKILQNLLKPIPSIYKNLFSSMDMGTCLNLLPYGIGILETEKSLQMVAKKRGKQDIDVNCIEEYLQYGPLIPSSIRNIFKDPRGKKLG